MAQDDRPDDRESDSSPERSDDPDRAAILARRRRFIAIALSGLAGPAVGACTPQPCLNVPAKVDEDGEEAVGDPEPKPKRDLGTADPAPCLKVAPRPPEPPPEAPPRPCLNVVTQPDPDDEVAPRPCLKVAPPPKDPAPKPCLRVAPPPEEPNKPPEEPAPKPCLRVAKPEPK